MASARKKQDEKHLKILRELVSLPANKQCFDCYQRGPTYINMTIGSFVCTSCSGMLRGLTPPHRVKSISMASFSPEEIELIKSRGNEYCRRIWLGLYDANHGHTTTKDEQQIKDFMIAKYEKKTYYLDAAVANKNGFSPNGTLSDSRTSTPTPSLKSGTPETKPLSTLLGQQPSKSSFSLKLQQNSTVSTDNMFTPDKTEFLTDFTSDPFSSSSQFNTQETSTQPSFANFDNFSSSSTSLFDNFMSNEIIQPKYNTNRWSMPGALTLTAQSPAFGSPARKFNSSMLFGQNQNTVPPPPSEDKYAALKDLDFLMKSQQQQQQQHQQQHLQQQHLQQQQQLQQQQHQQQHLQQQQHQQQQQQQQQQQHRLSDPMHMSEWNSGSAWPSVNGGANHHTAFGSPAQTTVNPFTAATADPWASTNGVTHVVNSSFVGNPFQARQNIGTTVTHGFGWPTMTNGSGSQPLNGQQPFTSSQSLQSMHIPAKPWPNPFAIGGTPTPAGNSSNPFL